LSEGNHVSEAELLQGLFASVQTVLSIFSMFFAMVSGYIAALYFFLAYAPFTLKLMAFALLSIGLVFLGGSAASIGTVQEGLYTAWEKLPSPILDIHKLRNPLPVTVNAGVSLQEVGVAIGWIVAICVYLALAYLTFIYRWPKQASAGYSG
jgi:hypothetical protein